MPNEVIGNREPTPEALAPLRKLHPTYTEDELKESYENLRRYLELGMRIVTRIEREDSERLKQMIKQAREIVEEQKKFEPSDFEKPVTDA